MVRINAENHLESFVALRDIRAGTDILFTAADEIIVKFYFLNNMKEIIYTQ